MLGGRLCRHSAFANFALAAPPGEVIVSQN